MSRSPVTTQELNSAISAPTSSPPLGPYAYSVADACLRLGDISRSNFYRRRAEGKIQTRKLGGRTVVMAEEVERVLNSLPASRMD